MVKVPKRYGVIIAITEEDINLRLKEKYGDLIYDKQQLEKILTTLALRDIKIPEEYWYKVKVKIFEKPAQGIICVRLTSSELLSPYFFELGQCSEYPQKRIQDD